MRTTKNFKWIITMKKSDDNAIDVQRILGRTHTGRVLDPNGDAMALMSDLDSIDANDRRVECDNCGFIFPEQYFVNGCPNCHAREPNDIGG